MGMHPLAQFRLNKSMLERLRGGDKSRDKLACSRDFEKKAAQTQGERFVRS